MQRPGKSQIKTSNSPNLPKSSTRMRWRLFQSAIPRLARSRLFHGFILAVCFWTLAFSKVASSHISYKVCLVSLAALVVFTYKFWPQMLFETLISINVLQALVGRFHWYETVDDNLLLGAIPLIEHLDILKSKKVAVVVSVIQPYEIECTALLADPIKPDLWKKHGIEHFILPTPDFFPPSLDILDRGANILDQALRENKTVYVHCKSGMGRSSSVVLAYFLKYRYSNMDLMSTYSKLKNRRSVVFGPKSWQMQQMQKYLKQIRPHTNSS